MDKKIQVRASLLKVCSPFPYVKIIPSSFASHYNNDATKMIEIESIDKTCGICLKSITSRNLDEKLGIIEQNVDNYKMKFESIYTGNLKSIQLNSYNDNSNDDNDDNDDSYNFYLSVKPDVYIIGKMYNNEFNEENLSLRCPLEKKKNIILMIVFMLYLYLYLILQYLSMLIFFL